MKKTNIFGLVLILSTLLIGCAQSSPDEDIPEVYTITCGDNVLCDKAQAMAGETITVTTESVANKRFSAIKLNDELISTESTATFTMPAYNVNVTADYNQLYNITAVVPDGVTVNKTSAIAGEEVTVTISGNFQSIITGVIVKKGTESIAVNADNNTFNMPEGNVEITVGLMKTIPIGEIEYDITISYFVGDIELLWYGGMGLHTLDNYDTYNDLYKSSIYIEYIGEMAAGYYSSEASIPPDVVYIEYIPDTITMTWDETNLPQINVSCIEKNS